MAAVAFWGNDGVWFGTLLGAFPVLGWLGLNLLCLLTVPKFRWRGWTLYLLLWAGFWVITGLPGRLEPAKDGELMVRVLTWNIDHIGGDIDPFVTLLKEADADVICLQEASDRNPYGFTHLREIAARLSGYDLNAEGDNAILTRVKAEKIERIEIPIEHYRRFVPVVTISTPKGDLSIANIHLVQGMWPGWIMRPGGLPRKLSEMQSQRESQLNFTLTQLMRKPGRIVLAGDFNLQPFGALHARLDGTLNDASASSVFSDSFPTPVPLYRIDRIWCSHDLMPTKRKIISSELSSHRPVVVDFVLR